MSLILSLDEWLDKLESRLPEHKMLLGTERVKRILPLLTGDQPIAKKVITVGGTNGKGSTVACLEHMLKASGLRYGATCSPHLFRYNERIRINGQPVEDETICASFERIEKVRADTFLSFFEFGALAAFDIFAQSNLDVAVLEIGLGGRLDAMNIIDPDVAVITTVDFDHQQWLGDTIEAIAAEKAGIFRYNVPAIYGDSPVPDSIRARAKYLQAKPLFRDEHFFTQTLQQSWTFKGINDKGDSVMLTDLPLPRLPFTSAVCAVQAALVLGSELSFAHIKAGLSTAWLHGRNHCIDYVTSRQQGITIRFDVAHNPQAGEHLASILEKSSCQGKRVALVAMLEGKDFAGTLAPLCHSFDEWHVSSVVYKPRALDGMVLKTWLSEHDISAMYHPSISDALPVILDKMNTDDELVVFGSFHTVEEVFFMVNQQ